MSISTMPVITTVSALTGIDARGGREEVKVVRSARCVHQEQVRADIHIGISVRFGVVGVGVSGVLLPILFCQQTKLPHVYLSPLHVRPVAGEQPFFRHSHQT